LEIFIAIGAFFMIFMNTHHLTRKVRKNDKTRSSSTSMHHPDPLIEPMLAMISSTLSVCSSSSGSSTEMKKTKSYTFLPQTQKQNNKNEEKKNSIIYEKSKFAKAQEINKENVLNHPFRNLIFSPEVTPEKFKDHLSLIQRGLIYSKACLKQPSAHYLKNKYINLSEKNRNYHS